MTEQEWFNSTEPEKMLRHLTHSKDHEPRAFYTRGGVICDGWHPRVTPLVSDRKFRLFGCECCRLNGSSMKDVEDYEANGGPRTTDPETQLVEDGHWAKGWCCPTNNRRLSQHYKADLWREIVGNPWSRIVLPEEFLTRAVRCMAATIYEERAWRDLPILADMLEDHGMTVAGVEVEHAERGLVKVWPNPILEHLRSPATHARGCRVVDLLCGRE